MNNVISVLLVDDDVEVLEVLKEYLMSIDCIVESYDDPIKALLSMEMNPERFTIALVDQHMPGMLGYDLAIQLRKMGIKLPVILSSGNHALEVEKDKVENLMFLDKPYKLNELNELLLKKSA